MSDSQGNQKKHFNNSLTTLLILALLSGSLWNYRDDIKSLLPASSEPEVTIEKVYLVDPSDPIPTDQGDPIPISKIPVMDRKKLATFKPDSSEGHEFLKDYFSDALGYPPHGTSILLYPELLRYLGTMYAFEDHVMGEGFNTYFYNTDGDSIRFIRKAYELLGFPELASIIKLAENIYVEHADKYELARLKNSMTEDDNTFWENHIKAGKDINWDAIDDIWSEKFESDKVYRKRYEFIMANWNKFSPAVKTGK